MKKKIALLLAGVLAITSLVGCGKKKEEPVKRSGEFEIVAEDCVKNICSYDKIPVELEDEYEVTQEILDYFYEYFLNNFGIKYIEVTDRTVVEENDIVLIGYKGFLGEEQFEGGTSKTDIYFDVKNNKDLTNGSGYVEGFNTGLKGATVGQPASSTLTFPENYNEKLGGKEVTFEFDIKGIYEKVTMENVTDQMIYDHMHDVEVDTIEDFKKSVKLLLEDQAASQKFSDTVDAIRDYVVENSEVVIPEGYEEARYNEYIKSLESEIPEGKDLAYYVKATYGVELSEAEEVWHETIKNEIKAEILFTYIANKEGLTLDEEGYNSYLESIVANNESFKEASDAYSYYGNGYADEGEAYVKRLYVVTLAIQFVEEKAEVTIKPADEKSTESSTEK